MDLCETERFTLAIEKGGVRQKLAFRRTGDEWNCVITDKGGEYERTFDFIEDVTYYIGARTLRADRVEMLERG